MHWIEVLSKVQGCPPGQLSPLSLTAAGAAGLYHLHAGTHASSVLFCTHLGGARGAALLLSVLPGQPQILRDHGQEHVLGGWGQVLLSTGQIQGWADWRRLCQAVNMCPINKHALATDKLFLGMDFLWMFTDVF